MILNRLKSLSNVPWSRLKDLIAFCKGNPALIVLVGTGTLTVVGGKIVYEHYQRYRQARLQNNRQVPPAAVNINAAANINAAKCDRCNESYEIQNSFKLKCGHSWHDDCLLANCLMGNLDHPPFGKCLDANCDCKISMDDMRALIKIFKKNNPNSGLSFDETEVPPSASNNNAPANINAAVCDRCEQSYEIQNTFNLECGHSWHDDCLVSHYLLGNLENPPFGKCLVTNCDYKVTEDDMMRLIAIFNSDNPSNEISFDETEAPPSATNNNAAECDRCGQSYENQNTFNLECGHSLHTDCLLSNSLLGNLESPPFGKCLGTECDYRITKDDMRRLITIFQSNNTLLTKTE